MPHSDGVLLPSQLIALRQALEDICLARGISPDSLERTHIASDLIQRYELGEDASKAVVASLTGVAKAA